ncbi:MAG: thioredoxin domain-containing protein [Acidobacteriia bacterium]|nr:thioredoxin domain-containing protein [Terriglobia bacterium]
MRQTVASAALALCLAFVPAIAQAPGTWEKITEFAGLDQSNLSAEQKQTLLHLLRAEGCNCGCTMHIAECRVKDPRCGRSRGMAAMVARELREGKTAESIRATLERRMKEAPPVLDEAVPIPIEGAPVKGPANARITLVEFSDFQCPYCAAAVHRIDEILAKHPADVRLVFKQFPLDIHSQAALAAEAALAAHAQGKFWPMHDKLYANFRDLSPDKIDQWAKEIGLDMARFTADLKAGKYRHVVAKELAQGEQAGVSGTPTLFVDGKHYNGPIETQALEEVLQAELKTLAARATPSPRSQ